ncbi:MAG: hypothetical protein AB7G44_06510 [Bacteroidia bacterium]
MKKILLLIGFLFCITAANAQDTIYLQNGREVREPKSQEKKLRIQNMRDAEFKRNIISFNVLDLMLKNISFSVDFVPGEGKVGITMPLTFYSPLGKAIQNANSSDMGKYHKELATYIRAGFDLNYYPLGQRKYTWVTGVSMQGAYLKRDVDVQVDENKGVYQGLYFYFMGKTGVQCTYWKRFTLSFIVHTGVKTPDVETWHFAMLGNVGVGVRF